MVNYLTASLKSSKIPNHSHPVPFVFVSYCLMACFKHLWMFTNTEIKQQLSRARLMSQLGPMCHGIVAHRPVRAWRKIPQLVPSLSTTSPCLSQAANTCSTACKGRVIRWKFSCNSQCNSTLWRYKIGKYKFPSQFANIFLTYQTFVTNFLHLLRVELRCKLQEKLHRVTGP